MWTTCACPVGDNIGGMWSTVHVNVTHGTYPQYIIHRTSITVHYPQDVTHTECRSQNVTHRMSPTGHRMSHTIEHHPQNVIHRTSLTECYPQDVTHREHYPQQDITHRTSPTECCPQCMEKRSVQCVSPTKFHSQYITHRMSPT